MVNVHYPTDSALYFAICRRLLPIRLVTSVHGRDAFYQEQPLGRFSAAFRSVIHASDAVILPSDAYRQKFAAAFPRVRDRTRFIHNGIDPDVFAASVAGGQERRAADPYLLCVAELQEYKAIDVLLRAAQPLLAGDPRLTLVLAGDGPLRDELEELSYALGIDRQTKFLGTQGAAQVVRLLQGCSVMVLPSRMEPFGIALLEAMACRAPVVATRVGGITEVIEHGISGILVEPESPEALTAAVQCVLADRALRERIAENGHARVMERFCATHTGSAYEQVFASCSVRLV